MAVVGGIEFEVKLDLSGIDAQMKRLKDWADKGLDVTPKIDRKKFDDFKSYAAKELKAVTASINIDIANERSLDAAIRKRFNDPFAAKVKISEANFQKQVDSLKKQVSQLDGDPVKLKIQGTADFNADFRQNEGAKKLAESIGKNIKKSMSEVFDKTSFMSLIGSTLKLPLALFGGIISPLVSFLGTAALGAGLQIGTRLSQGLSDGLVKSLEAKAAPMIGSLEVLGDKIGGAIASGIQLVIEESLPSSIRKTTAKSLQDFVGQKNIYRESRYQAQAQAEAIAAKEAIAAERLQKEYRQAIQQKGRGVEIQSQLKAQIPDFQKRYIAFQEKSNQELQKLQARAAKITVNLTAEDLAKERTRQFEQAGIKQQVKPEEITKEELAQTNEFLTQQRQGQYVILGMQKVMPEKKLLDEEGAKLRQLQAELNKITQQIAVPIEGLQSLGKKLAKDAERVPLQYKELVQKVTELSGLQFDEKKLPAILTGNLPVGANASYEGASNSIKVSSSILEAIQSNNISSLPFKELETLVHEIRHAAQSDFGKNAVEQTNRPSVSLLTPSKDEIKQFGKNIEFSTGVHSASNQPLVRKLEADAYTFASRNTQKIQEEFKRQKAIESIESKGGIGGAKLLAVLERAFKKIEAISNLAQEYQIDANSEVLGLTKKAIDIRTRLSPAIDKAREIQNISDSELPEIEAIFAEGASEISSFLAFAAKEQEQFVQKVSQLVASQQPQPLTANSNAVQSSQKLIDKRAENTARVLKRREEWMAQQSTKSAIVEPSSLNVRQNAPASLVAPDVLQAIQESIKESQEFGLNLEESIQIAAASFGVAIEQINEFLQNISGSVGENSTPEAAIAPDILQAIQESIKESQEFGLSLEESVQIAAASFDIAIEKINDFLQNATKSLNEIAQSSQVVGSGRLIQKKAENTARVLKRREEWMAQQSKAAPDLSNSSGASYLALQAQIEKMRLTQKDTYQLAKFADVQDRSKMNRAALIAAIASKAEQDAELFDLLRSKLDQMRVQAAKGAALTGSNRGGLGLPELSDFSGAELQVESLAAVKPKNIKKALNKFAVKRRELRSAIDPNDAEKYGTQLEEFIQEITKQQVIFLEAIARTKNSSVKASLQSAYAGIARTRGNAERELNEVKQAIARQAISQLGQQKASSQGLTSATSISQELYAFDFNPQEILNQEIEKLRDMIDRRRAKSVQKRLDSKYGVNLERLPELPGEKEIDAAAIKQATDYFYQQAVASAKAIEKQSKKRQNRRTAILADLPGYVEKRLDNAIISQSRYVLENADKLALLLSKKVGRNVSPLDARKLANFQEKLGTLGATAEQYGTSKNAKTFSELKQALGDLNAGLKEFGISFVSLNREFDGLAEHLKELQGIGEVGLDVDVESIAKPKEELGAFSSVLSQLSLTSFPDFVKVSAAALKGFLAFHLLSNVRNWLLGVAQASLEVSRRFQVLQNTLDFISGGKIQGGETFKFIAEEVKRTSSVLEPAAQGFAKLAASARNTKLEGQPVKDIFSAITQASGVFGLSAEETSGAILAVSQMIGKGVVSAEELRGQLAERIPGAFQVAARAMGLTEQELFKLMASGQLASTEFLPKFAQQLSMETQGGVAGAAKTAQGAINRLNNAVATMQSNIGKSLAPIQVIGLDVAEKGVKALSENIGFLVQSFLVLGASLAAGLLPLLRNVIVKFLELKFSSPANALGVIGLQLKALAIQFVAATAAVEGIKATFQAIAILSGNTESRQYADSLAQSWQKVADAAGSAKEKIEAANQRPQEPPSAPGPLGAADRLTSAMAAPINAIANNPLAKSLRKAAGLQEVAPEFRMAKWADLQQQSELGNVESARENIAKISEKGLQLAQEYKQGLGVFAEVQALDRQIREQQARVFNAPKGSADRKAEQAELDRLTGERSQKYKAIGTLQAELAKQIQETRNRMAQAQQAGNIELADAFAGALGELERTDAMLKRIAASAGEVDPYTRLTKALMEVGDALTRVQRETALALSQQRLGIVQKQVKDFSSNPLASQQATLAQIDAESKALQQQVAVAEQSLAKQRSALNDPAIKAELKNAGLDLDTATLEEIKRFAETASQENLKEIAKGAARTAEIEQELADRRIQLAEKVLQRKQQVEQMAIASIEKEAAKADATAKIASNDQIAKIKQLQRDRVITDAAAAQQIAGIQQGASKSQLANLERQMAAIKSAYAQGKISAETFAQRERELAVQVSDAKVQTIDAEIQAREALKQKIVQEMELANQVADAAIQSRRATAGTAIKQEQLQNAPRMGDVEASRIAEGRSLTADSQATQAQISELQKRLRQQQDLRSRNLLSEQEYTQAKIQLQQQLDQALDQSAQQQIQRREITKRIALEELEQSKRVADAKIQTEEILAAIAARQQQLDTESTVGAIEAEQIASRAISEARSRAAQAAIAAAQDQINRTQQLRGQGLIAGQEYTNKMIELEQQLNQARDQALQAEKQRRDEIKRLALEKIDIRRQEVDGQIQAEESRALLAVKQKQLQGYGGASTEGADKNAQREQARLQVEMARKRIEAIREQLAATSQLNLAGREGAQKQRELNQALLDAQIRLVDAKLEERRLMMPQGSQGGSSASAIADKAAQRELERQEQRRQLIESRLNKEKALSEAIAAALQSQSELVSQIASGADKVGAGMELQVRAVELRQRTEERAAEQRRKILQQEQESARILLQIDQRKADLQARQQVSDARAAAQNSQKALQEALVSGDRGRIAAAKEEVKDATERLAIAQNLLGIQQTTSKDARDALDIQQKSAIAQAEIANNARRYGAEIEKTQAALKATEQSLDVQKKLIESSSNLSKAKGDLTGAQSENQLSQIERALDLRRKLDQSGLSPFLSRELKSQLGQLGFSGQSELGILQAKEKLEAKIDAQKMEALASEQLVAKSLLELDLKRSEATARQAIAEAKILKLRAQQEAMLARRQRDAGGARAAQEAVSLAEDYIAAAQKNIAVQQKTAEESRQALDYQQKAARDRLKNESTLKGLQRREEIAGVAGGKPKDRETSADTFAQKQLENLERYQKLAESRANLQKAISEAVSANLQGQQEAVAQIVTSLDKVGASAQVQLQAARVRQQIEGAIASQKQAAIKLEHDAARTALEIDLKRADLQNRQRVADARSAAQKAQESLQEALSIGDADRVVAAREGLAQARESLGVAQEEAAIQNQIAANSRRSLQIQQQSAIAQTDAADRAKKYNNAIEKSQAILKGIEQSLDTQRKILDSYSNLGKSKIDLKDALSEGQVSRIDRALDIRRRLNQGGLSRRVADELKAQLAALGFGKDISEQGILQAKSQIEAETEQRKYNALLQEQSIQMSLLEIDLQRAEASARQMQVEGQILQLKAKQEMLAAARAGDATGVAIAQRMEELAAQQVLATQKNLDLQGRLSAEARSAMQLQQEAARQRFQNESYLKGLQRREELATASRKGTELWDVPQLYGDQVVAPGFAPDRATLADIKRLTPIAIDSISVDTLSPKSLIEDIGATRSPVKEQDYSNNKKPVEVSGDMYGAREMNFYITPDKRNIAEQASGSVLKVVSDVIKQAKDKLR